jgi:hypothetical protein
LFSAYINSSDYIFLTYGFSPADTLALQYGGGNIDTAAVYRDPSAWMHVVFAVDTTQATAANRLKIYVNNVLQATSGATISQNSDLPINASGTAHTLGSGYYAGPTLYFNGYLAECYLIDGQALTPSSFTEVSATTGQLIPKAYSGGSYGTNGFYLKFDDNSTTAALGTDSSGNGNTWTTNNFSVTAGAGNDSLVDTPTSYGTDTGVGGEVRGNYCTWNPLARRQAYTPGVVYSNGNLDLSLAVGSSDTGNFVLGTIGVSSGKWYFEVTRTNATDNLSVGFATANLLTENYSTTYWYSTNGTKFNNGSSSSYGSTTTNGDIIGIAVNLDTGAIEFFKNGTSMGVAFSSMTLGNVYFPLGAGPNGTSTPTMATNFGQRAFAYPVSGYKALVDTNLGAPVVAKPNTLMDVALWAGNGGSQTITLPGAFSPDFVWIKRRSSTFSSLLYDTIRGNGPNTGLISDSTTAEGGASDNATYGYLNAFNSTGFALTAGSSSDYVNTSGQTYVGWAWDAGTSTVSNPDGSITSQVRANASAGFSIVTFTSPSSGSYSVGHGLGVAPSLVIWKSRANTSNWVTYHQSVGAGKYLLLNTTVAASTEAGIFDTSPSSTVISIGSGLSNFGNCVCYAFAPVVGYSSFGSYTGTSGQNFVHLGFRPKLLMIKNSSNGSFPAYTGWAMFDSSRSTYNVNTNPLWANSSQQEGLRGNGGTVTTADFAIDLLSNGFCLRDNGASEINLSSNTYIFAAWAENPFQYARAR